MLVTLKNSDLIDKLVELASGNIELVRAAIIANAEAPGGGADLKKVVEYIVTKRRQMETAA